MDTERHTGLLILGVSLVAAVAVVAVGQGLRSLPEQGTPAQAEQAQPTRPVVGTGYGRTVESTRSGDLRVDVLLPSALEPGSQRPVVVKVRTSGGPLDGDALLSVRLELRLDDDARGRLWIEPSEYLGSGDDLRESPPRITTASYLRCGTSPGTLTIAVSELSVDGRSAERTLDLPGIVCDGSPPPAASEVIHILTPVCGDRAQQDLETLADGGTPPPASCRPDSGTQRRSPDTSDEPDAAEEPSDETDADPQDAAEEPEGSPDPEPDPQPDPDPEPDPDPDPEPEPDPEPAEPDPDPEPSDPDAEGESSGSEPDDSDDGEANGSSLGDGAFDARGG